jgi:hypothetical protein
MLVAALFGLEFAMKSLELKGDWLDIIHPREVRGCCSSYNSHLNGL